MSKKAVNVILLTISQGVNVVLLFLFTPYLVRALEKSLYGSYLQVVLIADVISIITSIAVVQIAMMLFSNLQKNIENSLKTVIVFTLTGGLIGALLCVAFSYIAPHIFDNDYSLFGQFIRIFAISIIGNKLNQVLNQAMIKVGKTKFLMVLSIVTNFSKLLLALIAIKYYQSVTLLLLIYALEPIVSSLCQLFVLHKMNMLSGKYDATLVKEIFSVGLPLYIVELLGNSYTYIAGFVISIYLNAEQYAIYRNGSIELPIIGVMYVTISTIFMADMSINIQLKNFEVIAAMKKKIITTTAIVLFPVAIFFIFYSKEFILLYMSEKYVDSYKVFIIFSLALLIRFQNYTDVLILLKKSKYVLISFLVFILLNISLNLLLSKYFGILGCAIATIFSVYVLAYMQLHIVIKQLKVSYLDYIDVPALIKILLISFGVIGVSKILFYYVHLPILYTFILAGITTLPLLMIYFVKNKYIEIHLYKSIFDKIPIFGTKIYKLLSR
ncbi:MAG: oligosaccharide flippase family protein [Bacteroidetes bacterium]|jgi:O-antigen/teichoic acid export membrane protein|nr:oligosaccharide flippase family protein [Bacteroidota bacterium]MBK6818844.1 oligosaccharide flippase family protein [Bacteroidota bacterium]MBK7041713.1 oligosaccharide flippase family protein [Bacteroidota bacterium]MBK9301109.1 oligosaccharide flippase family protein [Bacteroidota bacterium]